MRRREFPRKVMEAAWRLSGGLCEECTAVLSSGNIRYDHRIADGLGGEPTLENCAVLCRGCHDKKTAKHDVPAIARAKRREARHIGAHKSRSPFRVWRKFDGTIVRRS